MSGRLFLLPCEEAEEPMSPTDIAAVTSMKVGNVRKLLVRLVRDGLALRCRGGVRLAS